MSCSLCLLAALLHQVASISKSMGMTVLDVDLPRIKAQGCTCAIYEEEEGWRKRRSYRKNGQEGNKLQTDSMALKCENKIPGNGAKNLLALWQIYQIACSNNFSVIRVSYHRDFVALV